MFVTQLFPKKKWPKCFTNYYDVKIHYKIIHDNVLFYL